MLKVAAWILFALWFGSLIGLIVSLWFAHFLQALGCLVALFIVSKLKIKDKRK